MAYERLNLPKGTVLKEHHIAHIENGIVNLEAKASEIESVAVQQSYDEGYEKGYKSGYNIGEPLGHQEGVAEGWEQGNAEGWANGSQEQYNAFWDAFQQNGTRQNYENGFAGKGWYTENLKPKYDITPSYASNMFLNTEYKGDLRDLPVKLDFSKSGSMANLLGYAYGVTGIGVVDASSSANCQATFTYARALQTVEKLILKNDGSQALNNAFTQCYELQNIVVEGVIGQDVNLQHSTKLSKASITSIINALKSDASGKTLTLSQTAKNNAFTTDEWNTLVATKSNWTISLV